MVLVPVPSAPPTASTAQSASWALLRSHPHRGVSDDPLLRRGSHRANLQSLPPKSDHDRAMEVLRAMKPSSSEPSLAKKPTRWGSLGAVVRASNTSPAAKKPQPLNLTPYELLERVDALFSTLEAAQAEADGADGAARRPKEELKHIATKLGPLADALLLPMKRFDGQSKARNVVASSRRSAAILCRVIRLVFLHKSRRSPSVSKYGLYLLRTRVPTE